MSTSHGTKWPGVTLAAAILYGLAFGLGMPAETRAQPAITYGPTQPPLTRLPPPPATMARVWFLRQFQPGESLATPWIYVNGAGLTTSQPGTIFYRDLAPGTYTFSVWSCGTDVNQSTTLELAPGSQAELEVQSLSSFTPPDCLVRETFYVRPVAPRFLQLYLPQLAYLGGS